MKQPIFSYSRQINNDFKTTDPEKVDPEDLPKVKAFEDEFTRGYLQSTEETGPRR